MSEVCPKCPHQLQVQTANFLAPLMRRARPMLRMLRRPRALPAPLVLVVEAEPLVVDALPVRADPVVHAPVVEAGRVAEAVTVAEVLGALARKRPAVAQGFFVGSQRLSLVPLLVADAVPVRRVISVVVVAADERR